MPIAPLDRRIDPIALMGDWYVQIAWPTPFDRRASNGLEQYWWSEERQRVAVKYTFNTPRGKQVVFEQRGGVDAKNPNGTTWWVQPKVGPFFVPFRLPYVILDTDATHSYLVATSPSTTGFGAWCYIMTREKHVSDDFLAPLKKTATDVGWDAEKAERLVQGGVVLA